MKYIITIIAALYALVSILASCVQIKVSARKDTSLTMICGGVLLLLAVLTSFFGLAYDWILAVFGGFLISVAAYLNGKRSGKVHANHHIIRFLLTLALVVGFILL